MVHKLLFFEVQCPLPRSSLVTLTVKERACAQHNRAVDVQESLLRESIAHLKSPSEQECACATTVPSSKSMRACVRACVC